MAQHDKRPGRSPVPASDRAGSGRRTGSDRSPPPPGLAKRENEPAVPSDVDTRDLHRGVRAELRGLPKDLAEIVAAHLIAAGRLIDEDPELAHAHAEAARRRAARLPIVREAAAETAYAAGAYESALSEFRALRRMTGTNDYLPVMADCERALGRPQSALKLAKESRRLGLDPALQIEMIIVEAGARADVGQQAEALRLLEQAVQNLGPVGSDAARTAAARLHYAYADALVRSGRDEAGHRWFGSAAALDIDHQTDAAERRDELEGLMIDFDESAPEST